MRNKLDKMFGPAGTSAGIILVITGLVMTYYSISALILVLIGAFVGFTSTSTTIDFDNKRIRFSNDLFGIIPTGQWIPVQTNMKIGIKRSRKAWRTYSRSNRTLDSVKNDYRLILYDHLGNEILPLKKSDDPDTAKSDLDKLSKQLGIGIF